MSRTHRKPPAEEVTPGQAGGVLALAFLIVYLLTRTRDLGGDGTVFAQSIEAWLRHGRVWWTFFHPHHILYNPLVALVTAAGRVLAPGLLTVDAGAFLSAAFAAATVSLVTALLMRRGLPTGIAILSGTVMGLSGGFWQFATRLEVYTLAAMAVAVWLALLSREAPGPGPAGMVLGGALLSHLALGVLAPATFLRTAPPARRRATALALGLGGPALALATLFSLRLGCHPGDWLRALEPTSSDHYLHADPLGPLRALSGLLWWGWYRGTPVLHRTAVEIFDHLALLSSIPAVVLVCLGALRIRPRSRRTPLTDTAFLALGGFLPLWLLWDTGNVEHAVASAPLWAVLLAVGAQSLPRRLGPVLLAILALCLAVGNGLGSAIPQSRPENGRVWLLASFVRETVPPDAVLLSVGSDPRLRLGLPYLSGRHVVDLTLAAAAARRQGRDPGVALLYWLQRARAAGTAWLLPDVLDPASERQIQELGIPLEAWHRAVALFRVEEVRTLPPDHMVLLRPFRLTLATVQGGDAVPY